MKLKNAYDDHSIASNATGLECKDPSKTQQHDEHDANINNIVATYMRTRTIEGHNKPPINSDFTMITSMQDAMQLIVDARESFMEQPAQVRAKFDNDPAKFVDFCSREENRDAMRQMGLLSEEEMARNQAKVAGMAALAEANRIDAERFRDLQRSKE